MAGFNGPLVDILGVNGLSAPIFDHTGNIVAAITSPGAVGYFEMR